MADQMTTYGLGPVHDDRIIRRLQSITADPTEYATARIGEPVTCPPCLALTEEDRRDR